MKVQKIIGVILLFFWMAIIFAYSAQPAAESSKLSGQVVTGLQEAGKSFSILDRLLSWGKLEFLVRKTAHVMEYAVLGSLVLFNIENWFFYKKKRFYLLFSTGLCAIYAASDELHQYFVPGRSCQIGDILLDSFGAFLGICITFGILNYLKRHAKRTQKSFS